MPHEESRYSSITKANHLIKSRAENNSRAITGLFDNVQQYFLGIHYSLERYIELYIGNKSTQGFFHYLKLCSEDGVLFRREYCCLLPGCSPDPGLPHYDLEQEFQYSFADLHLLAHLMY